MTQHPLIFLFLGSLGLVFGSFLNVVIYRWPREISMFISRSQCRSCNKTIPWFCNVPVFSFLALRARCWHCGESISWRYPLVEVVTGIAFCALPFISENILTWPFLAFLVCGLVVTFFIDLDWQLIPDFVTYPGMLVGFAYSFVSLDITYWQSALGILVGFGGLWAFSALYYVFTKREGIGGGDIKFMGFIGAFFGVSGVLITITSGSVIGSFIGVAIMLKHKTGGQMRIAFGPFLVAGVIVHICFGQAIWHWYTDPLLFVWGIR